MLCFLLCCKFDLLMYQWNTSDQLCLQDTSNLYLPLWSTSFLPANIFLATLVLLFECDITEFLEEKC